MFLFSRERLNKCCLHEPGGLLDLVLAAGLRVHTLLAHAAGRLFLRKTRATQRRAPKFRARSTHRKTQHIRLRICFSLPPQSHTSSKNILTFLNDSEMFGDFTDVASTQTFKEMALFIPDSADFST